MSIPDTSDGEEEESKQGRERGGLWGRRGCHGDPPVEFLEKWVFGFSESDEEGAALRV